MKSFDFPLGLLQVLAFITSYPTLVRSSRILSVFLLCGRSSMNYFDPIHLELAKRGHHITVISPTRGLVEHENIEELAGVNFAKLFQGMSGSSDYFQMRLSGERMAAPFSSEMSEKFACNCDAFHQLPAIQEIMTRKDQFDLVMTMAFMNECVYGLIHHLNTSSVIIGATPTMPWFAGATGTPTLASFVPHIYFPATHQMSFWERARNLASLAYTLLSREYVYSPQIESVYRKYFPKAVGIDEVERNVSLFMGAGHPSFGPLRPTMPDLIDDIGGIHCRPGKPLPEEVRQMFTDENGEEQDFIFFSFGSIVPSHQMPVSIQEEFLKAFGKLEGIQVLWKWEANVSSSIEIPGNVKLAKWYPQQDLLAHPKCKLFITHGGLSSVHEAIFHAVPLLGIPFFGDQDWNMRQVGDLGIGEKMELSEIQEERLTEVLLRILKDAKYKEAMKKRSELFRDRQVSPLETAVWNIEHVLRHGGGMHMKSPSRRMNLIQYYSVDIILFLLVTSVVFFCLVIHYCYRLCCKSKAKNKRD